MYKKLVWLVCLSALFITCAQVPRESVELSTTIGRDLAAVHESHRELAQILFDRMKGDINRFVDQVYAPHQINVAMARQQELAESPNESDRSRSLLLAINAAFQDDASPELQEAVLQGMNSMVLQIRNDVESMREEMLAPVLAQEQEVLNSIDRAYQQIHYANSIITGHLVSIAEVHDAQADLMAAVGVEQDLRSVIGTRLSQTSRQISDIVDSAEQAESNLPMVEENIKKLRDTLNELRGSRTTSNEENE